jgi:DNA-binding transcriptional LysR family regulator
VGGSENIAADVRDGELDLGILSLPGEYPGLELVELGSEPMLLACASGHPLAHRETVSLRELVGEPFVDGPPGWGIRIATDEAFAAAGVRRSVTFEVNDTQSIVQFVGEGLAIALLPASIVQGAAASVQLVALEQPTPVFRTLLASPAGRRLRASVLAFTEFVRADVASAARG